MLWISGSDNPTILRLLSLLLQQVSKVFVQTVNPEVIKGSE
jgi:hypothetical protein